MLILWLMAPAHAGCGVDEDQDARQQSAPLVVSGTVTDIRVQEQGTRRVVVERVRVDQVYKGAVESGVIELTTSLPSHGCASSWIVPMGETVRVIGTPDALGQVPMSVCTSDVSRRVDVQELQVLAAAQPETAASFPGAPAQAPPTVLPALEPGTDQLVSAWLSEQWRIGHQVHREHAVVTARWQVDGLQMMGSVAAEDLRPVVGAPWTVSGLTVAVGTPVRGDALALPEGVTWTTPVPASVVSDTWIAPEPTSQPEGSVLTNLEPVLLYDAPDGTLLVRFEPAAMVNLIQLQEADGWTQVHVDHAGVSGSAWTPSQGLTMGMWGFGSGGIGSTTVLVDLEPGMDLRALGTDTVVAHVTEAQRVPWLYKQADTIVVALDTPWGWVVAETECVHCAW
jgi:hypothetical protein